MECLPVNCILLSIAILWSAYLRRFLEACAPGYGAEIGGEMSKAKRKVN